MHSLSRKLSALGFVAIGFSLLTHSAKADPPALPAYNLNFLNYTGSDPKAPFTSVDPVGWTFGGGGNLVFIDDSSNSSSDPNSACGSIYLNTYGCPGTLAITGGYNQVEADGNPDYESVFDESISGLTAGVTYSLSFYQAASQQVGYSGSTTEQWIVSLGTSVLTDCPGCLGGGFSSYSNADPTASIASTNLMNTPSEGVTTWNFVTVDLKADSTTDLLSFLAWGDNGNTANLPPIVFLTAVNAVAGLATPEPESVALFGTLLLGLGVVAWRRRLAAKV